MLVSFCSVPMNGYIFFLPLLYTENFTENRVKSWFCNVKINTTIKVQNYFLWSFVIFWEFVWLILLGLVDEFIFCPCFMWNWYKIEIKTIFVNLTQHFDLKRVLTVKVIQAEIIVNVFPCFCYCNILCSFTVFLCILISEVGMVHFIFKACIFAIFITLFHFLIEFEI